MTQRLDSEIGAELTPSRRAWLYFYRSLRWTCPVCGLYPLFCPVSRVRNLNDWFATLPGCPHCQYAYDREPGYFLLAFWMFDYGLAALFGIALFLTLSNFFQLSVGPVLVGTLIPVTIFALLIVRHAKAIYLAMDHYLFQNHEAE